MFEDGLILTSISRLQNQCYQKAWLLESVLAQGLFDSSLC